MEVIDDVPVGLDVDSLIAAFKETERAGGEQSLRELGERVLAAVNARILYDALPVRVVEGDVVEIGGQEFESRVLRVNLQDVDRAFPFIATLGPEVDAFGGERETPAVRAWINMVKYAAVRQVMRFLEDHLAGKFEIKGIAYMNPGSGFKEMWPIEQQEQLFAIFGNVEKLIGVKLVRKNLMLPMMSVSGVFFPSKLDFKSCKLCSRENCQLRRAPMDPAFMRLYFRKGK